MTKATALKILNPILALLFLNQAATGLLADELPREAFEILHEGGAYVLIAAVALHVFLNWNWVKATFFRKKAAVPAPGVRT